MWKEHNTMNSSLEKAIIRRLQEEIPLVPEPYKLIADELGISEQQLIESIKTLRDKKVLRRIAGILHHRTVGFKANAMVVWSVPSEKVKEVTDVMISLPQVSHCYERKTNANWPYNIYTMIHAETFEICEDIILQIAKAVAIDKYEALYSVKELKKSSMKYFLNSIKA